MKRVIICVSLIAAMAVTGVILDLSAADTAKNISERLSALPFVGDTGERAAEAEAILSDWEDFCVKNIFLVNNEGAFEITKTLIEIRAEAEKDDGVSEECEQAKLLLRSYTDSRRLSPDNIF